MVGALVVVVVDLAATQVVVSVCIFFRLAFGDFPRPSFRRFNIVPGHENAFCVMGGVVF
jgi:hypothetical protein